MSTFLVNEDILHQRLCSESALLIRREDVLQRLTPDCGLSDLSDPRWKALDVQGEAVARTFSPRVFLMLQNFGRIRAGEEDVSRRGRGWSQVDTHQDPRSIQFRHHTLCSATVSVGEGAPQSSRAPFVVW